MRAFTFSILCFLAFSHQAGATLVKFVEMTSFHESENLPPKLEATFTLACNQKFLQVLRYETINSDGSTITIHIGALVAESPVLCQEPALHITHEAGYTYSGRHYEVKTMRP